MNKEVVSLFNDLGIQEVILTQNAFLKFNISSNLPIIADARSATFFAIGRINVTMKPAILIVDAKELPNALTGITEANYQYLPLIIVALESENCSIVNVYDHVTQSTYGFDQDNLDHMINKVKDYIHSKWHKPLLIHLLMEEQPISNDRSDEFYNHIVKVVLEKCSDKSQLLVQRSLDKNFSNIAKEKDIELIFRDSNYGTVSYFLGRSFGEKKKRFLITYFENIAKDINSFSLRNINKNIVIIYIKDAAIYQKLDSWFTNNGFAFRTVTTLNDLYDVIDERIDKPLIIECIRGEGR